jgi:hypothetical protein
MSVTGTTGGPYFFINGAKCGIYVGEDGEGGGIVPSWGDRGLELTVYLSTAWGNIATVLQGLRGQVSYSNSAINRVAPWQLPNTFTNTLVNAQRYVCDGTGEIVGKKYRTDISGLYTGMSGWGMYESCIIPAHFSVPSYQVAGGVLAGGQNDPSGQYYTTTTFSTSGEVFCPPSGTYRYEKNPKVLVEDVSCGIARTRTEIKITRHYMPIIPLQENQAIMGSVNSYPIQFSDYTYPVGSLLVTGIPEVEPYADPVTGLLVWDIHYSLLANAPSNSQQNVVDATLDWNQFLTPVGTWSRIVDGSGNYPFPYLDLRGAIWPEYF